ncbi:Leucine rich repeat protein [Globisporangium polare]
MKEVKEDFQTLKKFFDVIKSKVNANAAKEALTASSSPAALSSSPTDKGAAGKAAALLKKTDAAKKFLSNFEQIVGATTAEKDKQDLTIVSGMAVRIVLRGHQRCGETAYVLGVKEEIAEVKMDVDGAIEFFPLMIPATKVEPAKYVLHKIPELAFSAAYTNAVNGKISSKWRGQLEAYAETIAEESKRFCAARVIQCAARVYLSRIKYQQELEAQGVNAARRQQALLRVLKTFGCANTRIANMLLQLRFVRALNLPPSLPDNPLDIQIVLDRFQRWLGRRSEIRNAYLRLVPEEFKGEGLFQGQMMPVPYVRVLDLLLHYPVQWLRRSTCVPIAQRLEKQGMAELANFIGGSEFAKTFEELHTDAKEHFFPQLQNCSFCASEGWSLVHSVFQKRKVPVDFPALRNSSKKKKFATKVVPHGWGVAHFLSGKVGKKRNWLARNSIEAQFKSLQIVKAMKQKEREERLESQILARQGTLNTLRSAEGARGYAKRHAELSFLEEKTKMFFKRYGEEIALRDKEEAKIFQEEQRLNEVIAKEKAELEVQGRNLNELQQQVPEVVVEIEIVRSSKSALEFLIEGCFIEVEYDDEIWYQCRVMKIDPYESFTADIYYMEDQRNEKIKLIEASMLDEKQFQKAASLRPKTVAEITAAAAAKAKAQEIPFRKWRAGNAVDISWEPPFDNGAAITQFIIEWKDEADETVTGKKEVGGTLEKSVQSGEGSASTTVPSKTTLWPIPPEHTQTLRVRIAAENKKGVGLASVYTALLDEMITDVSYLTAVPLIRPPEDTTMLERRETREMEMADEASLEQRRRLTCTICHENQPSEAEVHEHVAREHAIPLVCPFKSCRQVCASERALRYHIWRCSIPKPTPEELQSEIFMEIFNVSRQYSLRKPRRHILRVQSSLHEDGSGGEEVYLESKYQEARAVWFEKAKELHGKNLVRDAAATRRERENHYEPPAELFGLDFASPELNVARRNAVLSTIQVLQADLEAYVLETNTLMDQLKHEERELLDYIALKVKRMKTSEEEWQKQSLKREKKKAMKSLDQVQEKIATLMTTSTQRIHDMTAEIDRLTTIEKAFVPFTHQVIRTMRLGTLIRETHARSNEILRKHRVILDHFQEDLRKLMARAHHEVVGLEAWDTMIEARRKQLQALKDELRKLQLMHLAEMQSYKQKRDEGDEAFELKKLREQQIRVITRQERAAQELLDAEKMTRAQAAEKERARGGNEDKEGSFELATTIKSLGIVNHDLVLHEKFIKGKSEDAEYLRDEHEKQPRNSPANPMDAKFVDAIKEETGAAGQQATGEPSSETNELVVPDAASGGLEATDSAATADPNNGGMRKPTKSADKAKRKKKRLHELPHTYVRLECNFQDGFIRDHVRIEFNDGSVYEGPWVEDVHYDKPAAMEPMKTAVRSAKSQSHWGKFTYRDGTIWEGEDVDNFFSPFTATGDAFQVTNPLERTKYVGAVRMGKCHGFGTLHMNFAFTKGEYVGEWCEGKRHGYGIERFDVGEIYEGYWELDVYHGEGEIVYDDESRYEGPFRFGKWHGEGVRTLENGDRILGHFHEGFLNGAGVMEFADKRQYNGEFRNTRRHGMGVLTFPNGDRYEGPFEDDLPHGEGKFITKTHSENGGGSEPLVRMGKWVRGERTAWLSRPSSELATSTFISYFAVLQNVTGEIEMDLLLPKFTTPFAVMVASMLPTLPEGVESEDTFVKTIVRMLAKTQNVMVGTDILDKTTAEHAVVAQQLDQETVAYESLRNQADEVERELRFQTKKVGEQQSEVDAMTAKELETQVKLELFWKKGDAQALEQNYKRAVEMLHDVDMMDWYKLRTAKLDAVYMSLLEAFATLLNFTDNFYLQNKDNKLYKPTREEMMQLLSSSQENVFLGDKEGLIHEYQVKALYVLPLFDVYSFGEGTRNAMLHSITHVIHHPRLRPNNFRLSQISPAAAAVCVWVRAAFFYAKKAVEIYPVVKRVLSQLIVLERLRDALEQEKRVLAEQQLNVEAVRLRVREQLSRTEELRRRERELQQVITGVEELERNEHVPIEKQHVKRPQTYRPPSAAAGGGKGSSGDDGLLSRDGDDGEEEKTGETKNHDEAKEQARAAAQINHRQVFEETHDEHAAAKQAQRLQKEQVLEQILVNPELAQEFAILKKEIRKVIDRNDGKVALEEFPNAFLKIMLKPLDPSVYGVKKLRTLLALMDDTCVVVAPEKEGDVESVQLPVEPDDVPMLPRLACMCRFCPGVSYATRTELQIHEKTKWHFWNVGAKRRGEQPMKWTLASTFWSEAYDSVDGAICYFNRMTGEVVKGDAPPLEMQASDVLLELLEDEAPVESPEATESKPEDQSARVAAASEFAETGGGVQAQMDGDGQVNQLWSPPEAEASGALETAASHHPIDAHGDESEAQNQFQVLDGEWEEVADDGGNVYFYSRATGEASWTRPAETIRVEKHE